MSKDGHIVLNKYISLPENLQREVVDFIDFLMTRYQEEKQFKKSRSAGESVEKDKKRKSNFGSARGMIVMRSDFDEPLDDFKEYM